MTGSGRPTWYRGLRKALGIMPDQTTGALATDLDHLVAVGAKAVWLVVDISWGFPTSTTIDAGVAAKWDAIVNGAWDRGLTVIVQAHGSPAWIVTSGGHTYPGNPWHGPDTATERANWIACVHAFLNRYPAGRVHSITCWNEPNLVEFWVQGYNPQHYKSLLRDFWTDVKGTWPAIFVDGHAMARNDIGWLQQHYAWWDIDHGAPDGVAKRYGFDRLNVHPYCGDSSSGYAPSDTSHADITTDLGVLGPDYLDYRRLRDEIITKEGFAKPLVFGEFGYATQGSGWFLVTEANRASYVTSAIQLARGDGVEYLAVYYHWTTETPGDYATSFNIHGSAQTESAFTAA